MPVGEPLAAVPVKEMAVLLLLPKVTRKSGTMSLVFSLIPVVVSTFIAYPHTAHHIVPV